MCKNDIKKNDESIENTEKNDMKNMQKKEKNLYPFKNYPFNKTLNWYIKSTYEIKKNSSKEYEQNQRIIKKPIYQNICNLIFNNFDNPKYYKLIDAYKKGSKTLSYPSDLSLFKKFARLFNCTYEFLLPPNEQKYITVSEDFFNKINNQFNNTYNFLFLPKKKEYESSSLIQFNNTAYYEQICLLKNMGIAEINHSTLLLQNLKLLNNYQPNYFKILNSLILEENFIYTFLEETNNFLLEVEEKKLQYNKIDTTKLFLKLKDSFQNFIYSFINKTLISVSKKNTNKYIYSPLNLTLNAYINHKKNTLKNSNDKLFKNKIYLNLQNKIGIENITTDTIQNYSLGKSSPPKISQYLIYKKFSNIFNCKINYLLPEDIEKTNYRKNLLENMGFDEQTYYYLYIKNLEFTLFKTPLLDYFNILNYIIFEHTFIKSIEDILNKVSLKINDDYNYLKKKYKISSYEEFYNLFNNKDNYLYTMHLELNKILDIFIDKYIKEILQHKQ